MWCVSPRVADDRAPARHRSSAVDARPTLAGAPESVVALTPVRSGHHVHRVRWTAVNTMTQSEGICRSSLNAPRGSRVPDSGARRPLAARAVAAGAGSGGGCLFAGSAARGRRTRPAWVGAAAPDAHRWRQRASSRERRQGIITLVFVVTATRPGPGHRIRERARPISCRSRSVATITRSVEQQRSALNAVRRCRRSRRSRARSRRRA